MGINNSDANSNKKSFFSKLKQKLGFLKWFDPFTYVDLFVMPHVKKVTKNSFVELLVNVFFAGVFAVVLYSFFSFLFGSSTPFVIVYSASMENTFFRGDVMALSKATNNDFFGPEISLDFPLKKVPVINYVSPSYDSEGRLVSFNIGGKNFVYEKNGSIIIYSAYNPTSKDNGKPIIHRAIVKIIASDGNYILTKGDNDQSKFFLKDYNVWAYSNPTFDQDCGKISLEYEVPKKNCITLYAIPVDELQGKVFFRIPFVGCVKLWLFEDFSSILSTGKLPPDFRNFC
jgi:signal peptidase I